MLNTAIAQNNAWFKQWFNSSFYFKLYAQRNDAEAAGFIDALLHKVQPSSGATMLDLGCGNGRHSKYLAAKGFNERLLKTLKCRWGLTLLRLIAYEKRSKPYYNYFSRL